MALNRRAPQAGGIIHSAQGVQFASWGFSQKVTEAGLAPSVGAVGAPFDNAMVESFWARMQVELLNRRKWKTRVELATAIHDYIETWHNTRRRHSALQMLTTHRVREPTPTTTDRRLIPDHRLQETRVRSLPSTFPERFKQYVRPEPRTPRFGVVPDHQGCPQSAVLDRGFSHFATMQDRRDRGFGYHQPVHTPKPDRLDSDRSPKNIHICRPFPSGETGIRTRDTTIFSRVLYQLSYLAATLDATG
jgi:hypothetical protein